MSSKPGRLEISFLCKVRKSDDDGPDSWNLEELASSALNDLRHTLAFHRNAAPASVESSLAAACGMKLPLRLYDVHKGTD